MPTGRRLEQGGAPAGNLGSVRVLPPASAERIEQSRRHWQQASSGDFERVGKRWIDRATGTEYRRVHGDPLLDRDPATSDVSCFLVVDDSLVYLRPAGAHDSGATRVELGEVGARVATGHEPVDAGTWIQ
jgi:hypothetical protein